MKGLPTFMGGPKDGGLVPDSLWVLDTIELSQRLDNGHTVIYYYELNADSKNYIYMGQVEG
jgi:hypothetical protein